MMRFLCAERRGRTPARSIDAALLARLYSRNCDYLMIKCSLFSIVLPPISLAADRTETWTKKACQTRRSYFTLSASRFSLRRFEAREISGLLGATLPKDFFAAVLELVAAVE